MRKTIIILTLSIMTMVLSSTVSANQFFPEVSKIKPDIESVVTNLGSESGPMYEVIDRNPDLYTKQSIGNHTIEGWTENNKVYTKVDGELAKITQINAGLETVAINMGSESGPLYEVIDRNPKLYTKKVIGGHIVEGWNENNSVYTAIDGKVAKITQINADLETVVTNQGSESGPLYTVLDHNPTLYNKRIIGGHTVEGWTEDGKIYTKIDGVVIN